MGLLDKSFRYVHSTQTNIRKTIRKEQARLKAVREAQALADAEAKSKVKPIMGAK